MEEKKDTSVVDAMVRVNLINQTANNNLGITQGYNKENRDKLWDSKKGKADFKDKKFGIKQTYDDPISGKTLHREQKAAQNKYHMRNAKGEIVSSAWAEYSSETDHVNSLKDVHRKVKGNPFLTDDDFKEIMNSDENYRILSKSLNTSKGDKSDWEVIVDKDRDISIEGKMQIAKEKVKSDVVLTGKFALRTGKNVGQEFVVGAKDTLVNSAIPLTAEAVRKMIDVAQGKEDLNDAIKDMGKITVKVAVAGGTNKVVVDVVSSQLANSSSVVLQNVANSNQVAQIIAVAAIVQESAVKYINGEIDGQEFVEQVGVKGASMVAGMIGGQVGGELGGIIGAALGTLALPGVGTVAGYVTGEVIGQVLGTIITTVACSAIVTVLNVSKHLNDYKLTERQIRILETDALREMENQRGKFREIVEREYKVLDEMIQNGFDQIMRSACEENGNIQGIADGLDQILSVFGKNVKFRTIEDYEAQLDMPLKLRF